ncbi:MAG: winged helix-turn-helix transcriptional regulator [Candidatus Micrarchaeota archaeon]|nr:winged helix-turn-helix transcriptional regulator [Candidatus Micrarchaeota archaeon]
MKDNIVKLDNIDRKILFELDKNCRINTAKLGRIVRKSREAVKYRIRRLVEKGVITAFTISLNPNKL